MRELRKLFVRWNRFDDACAEAFAKVIMTSSTLEYVNVFPSKNVPIEYRLGEAGERALIEAAYNRVRAATDGRAHFTIHGVSNEGKTWAAAKFDQRVSIEIGAVGSVNDEEEDEEEEENEMDDDE